MIAEQWIYLVVHEVDEERGLGDDTRRDGERCRTRSAGSQLSSANPTNTSNSRCGLPKYPNTATASTTVTAARCHMLEALEAAHPIAKNQKASTVNQASRPSPNPNTS